MALIFHQNMLNYAGGNGAAAPPHANRTRNQQFDIDFNAIRAATGEIYVVAGFTELLNNGTAATEIRARARALDRGLRNCVVIGVGITVTGARDEHIGIAWDRNFFTIQNAGQVLFNAVTRQWQCHNTPTPVPATIPMPNLGNALGGGRKRKFDTQAAADSRGVAYIHGTWGGQTFVFGFMHNMHSVGDPTSSFNGLNAMMDAIHTAVNDNNTTDYIGGDFNIEPRSPGRGPLEFAAATYVSAGQTWFRDTTWYHPYDFWLTDNPNITNADAVVRGITLWSHSSDHAAITLVV
jgi:hypothetical protein